MNEQTQEQVVVVPFSFAPTAPLPFDAATHYWQIAGEPQVFRAATNTRVATADPAYQEWLGKGYTPTPIVSEADLWGVMQTHLPERYPDWLFDGTAFIQPAVNSYTTAQIKGYAAQKRWETETGGIDYKPPTGPSAGVVLWIKTDRESQSAIDAAAMAAQRSPAWTAQWKTADNEFHQLDANNIVELSGSVQWHIQRCFATENDCAGYTALSQVDQAFQALTVIEYPDPAQP
jgi:Domain of unknown function (DUF4376)